GADGGVHDPLRVGRQCSGAVGDRFRARDLGDRAGERERLGLDERAVALGQLGRRLVEGRRGVVGRALWGRGGGGQGASGGAGGERGGGRGGAQGCSGVRGDNA